MILGLYLESSSDEGSIFLNHQFQMIYLQQTMIIIATFEQIDARDRQQATIEIQRQHLSTQVASLCESFGNTSR